MRILTCSRQFPKCFIENQKKETSLKNKKISNFAKTFIDSSVDILSTSVSHKLFYNFERIDLFAGQITTALCNDIYLINFSNKHFHKDFLFSLFSNSISAFVTFNSNTNVFVISKYILIYTFAFLFITRFRYKCISFIDINILSLLSNYNLKLCLTSLLYLINNCIGSFQHTFISTLFF